MPDLVTSFVRWSALRAACHRGYWLFASLYLVVEADLSPLQLLAIGTVQGVVALVAEVPTGVFADTISRRTSVVVSHVLIGASMIGTALVANFPALLALQALWGVGWTFTSGADIAWITDELRRPDLIAQVLTARARWEMVGAAAGTCAAGAVAWLAGLSVSMVAAGVAMVALGVVARRIPERHFTPCAADARWRTSMSILRDGAQLVRRDRQILAILSATFLVNGAAEVVERLLPKRLVGLDLDLDGRDRSRAIVLFIALGLIATCLSAASLRVVEARLNGTGAARRIYVVAGVIGVVTVAGRGRDPVRRGAGGRVGRSWPDLPTASGVGGTSDGGGHLEQGAQGVGHLGTHRRT